MISPVSKARSPFSRGEGARGFAALAAVAFFALATLAHAQSDAGVRTVEPIAVADDVQPKTAKLGEAFVRTIVITHPRNERYELRVPNDLGAFELLSHERRRQDGSDKATTEFTLKMSAFEIGQLTLPPLIFDVTTPDGLATYTSGTNGIEIVSSLPPDADKTGADLYDIRPPEAVPVPNYALLWGGLIALAMAALAYVLYRWWKRPRPERLAPAGPPLPLEVRTRQALDQLRAEKLPERGLIKDFYVRLSEIVRGYVGQRFGIEALECTSSELIAALQQIPTPGLPPDEFTAFLQESDLVKFAKAPMTLEDCERALAFGYTLVDRTTPLPEPKDAPVRKLP